jgi:hypothetical protein
MASYYLHSRLTIAASSARSSTAGLFLTADPNPLFLGTTTASRTSPAITISTRSRPASQDHVHTSPLNARAWTLQETVISPRVLYCTEGQFYFQCRAASDSEDGTLGKPAWEWYNGPGYSPFPFGRNSKEREGVHVLWREVAAEC